LLNLCLSISLVAVDRVISDGEHAVEEEEGPWDEEEDDGAATPVPLDLVPRRNGEVPHEVEGHLHQGPALAQGRLRVCPLEGHLDLVRDEQRVWSRRLLLAQLRRRRLAQDDLVHVVVRHVLPHFTRICRLLDEHAALSLVNVLLLLVLFEHLDCVANSVLVHVLVLDVDRVLHIVLYFVANSFSSKVSGRTSRRRPWGLPWQQKNAIVLLLLNCQQRSELSRKLVIIR
jgi:hypothetical protein